jgi:energy-converting hydrogenase Eha subunit F
MEKRLNKKAESYVTTFKDSIREKTIQLGISKNENVNNILQYIYDYDRLTFIKEDFQKRKRVKNVVPIYDRCCAKRANNEQCTRRKKINSEFCGTHLKGTPHGIIDNLNDDTNTIQKIEVYAQDIQGIIYYIDQFNNVYQAEDIIDNKMNPKIIAKYVKNDDKYSIPEFNISN